jgi:hypothetical protein
LLEYLREGGMHRWVFVEPQYDADDYRDGSVPEEYVARCHLYHLLTNLNGCSNIGPLMIHYAPEELIVKGIKLERSQLHIVDLYLLEERLTEDAHWDALDLAEESGEVLEHLFSNLNLRVELYE